MTDTSFDMIVIGAGPAGENAADYAVKHGLTAAIVEKELVGGECSYWACMPSKALLRPTEVLAAVARVPAAAAAVTGTVDVEKVLALRDSFASNWDDQGQVDWLDSAGITLLRGHGRISGPKTVAVTDEDGNVATITANRAVVIATGTGAAIPPIDGLREIRSWDSRDITSAKQVPDRLVILGGGVVGAEMAQAWGRLGSTVTVIEAEERMLPRHEPFAGDELRSAFEAEGITVLTGKKMVKANRDADDAPVTAVLEDGTEITGDEIVVAVGRRPLTGDLGLDAIGVELGRGGFIDVDEHLLVTALADNDWLYVVGDANGRALLTHQGKYQARLVGAHAAGVTTDEAWADHLAVPGVVFTDPQIASVGRTEAAAREAGLDVRVVTYNTGHTAGAAVMGKGISGTSQLVINRATDTIVGATFIGPGVGEMLHAATIAIVSEITIAKLWHAVPAFPTMSEIWLRLLEETLQPEG